MKKHGIGKMVLLGVVLSSLIIPVWGAEKISALIIDGQNNHDWKLTTPYLQAILENTGIFEVHVLTSPASGEDMSGFNPSGGTIN